MPTIAQGSRLKVGTFGSNAGIALPEILDPLGRVLDPHPYNIPQHPWQILHFSLRMVLAMIDIGLITKKAFNNEQEYYEYRATTQGVINFVRMQEHVRTQPVPDADDGEWILYDPARVREIGESFSLDPLRQQLADIDADHAQPPKIGKGHKLVAVVEVAPIKIKPWTVAFDVTQRMGYHVLSTIEGSKTYEIELYLLQEGSLAPLQQNPPPPFA